MGLGKGNYFMKKPTKFGRLLAMILVVAMVLPMLPVVSWAALGDLATGVTNVKDNTFDNSKAPISLPIKIYDYLNDGMLFDYAEANASGQFNGGYAGGVAAPYSDGLIGIDYTGANRSSDGDPFQEFSVKNLMNGYAYGNNALNNWNLNGGQVGYSQVGAVDNVAPQYLNLRHSSVSGKSSVWISNFARDEGAYYSKDQVRYAVMVYRTNNAYTDGTLTMQWAESKDAYSTDYYSYDGAIDISRNDAHHLGTSVNIPKSTEWTYIVIDMKRGNISNNWNSLVNITGVAFQFPLDSAGEEMDISHIFYFSSKERAEAFGIQAVQFDKNPGIDLSKRYYGGASAPVVDIGLDFTNSRDLNGSGKDAFSSTSVTSYWRGAGFTAASAYDGQLRYAKVTNSDDYTPDYCYLVNFNNDESRTAGYPLWRIRYCVVVYKTNSSLGNNRKLALQLNRENGWENLTNSYTLSNSGSTWTYQICDLKTNANANVSDTAGINAVGASWPGLSRSHYWNISHIAFFDNAEDAEAFGKAAAAFDNNPGTRYDGGRGWNMGNNRAFGLLRGSNGGDIASSTANGRGQYSPRNNQANAYLSTDIGYSHNAASPLNKIYHVNMYNIMEDPYDTSALNFDGYSLLSYVTGDSLATMGMLESSLSPAGTPVYREETVAYLAELLSNSLVIPEINKREYFVDNPGDAYTSMVKTFANNYYNYNYVSGTPSAAYADANGNPRDLAQALRDAIDKIDRNTQPDDRNVGYSYLYDIMYRLGNYSDTLAKANAGQLSGSFKAVEPYIDTCFDAAYYLLNNLFSGGTYNTPKNDYDYLLLQPATVTSLTGKQMEAYVFDAGFTDGNTVSAESAVRYDAANKTISNVLTDGNSLGKTMYVYSGNSVTTFHPFLPITDSNNESGMTMSPYFQDPGVSGTDTAGQYYANRDFNYVLASNGEFVYREDDDLFFDFEGDDDVYLFINGELVMDIGGAHSISKVSVNINDYVTAARQKVAAGTATARDRALALEDGNSYTFDFFYMERHGYGANMRIVTNIRVTDPAMNTEKSAWQNDDKINFGGVINKDVPVEYGFSITNIGNNRLFNLTFEDKDIGVKLSPEKGLEITGDNVYDKDGGELSVTDLVAYVDGYSDWESPVPQNRMETIEVHFADNAALMAFLKTLAAEGTSAENGGGLWKHSIVSIRGIGYKLTNSQVDAGYFNNTVKTTSYSYPDAGGEPIHGEATMRVFVPSDPMYYQWANHELRVTKAKLIEDILDAADDEDNTLNGMVPNLTVNSVNSVILTTKSGNPIITTDTSPVKVNSDSSLSINYTKTGSVVFYVKIVYNSNQNSVVVPVLVNVTDVEDSVFVLDYGLNVNLTDAGGLTKNDTLTVPGRDTSWSLMGIGSNGAYANNKISFSVDTDGALRVENGNGTYTLRDTTLSYKPFDFMDQIESIQVAMNVYEQGITPSAVAAALNINKEVQMFKNVSVLPATVVYYEDNFPAIHYLTADENGVNEIQNTFEPVQTNDYYKNANQSVDQDQAYGQDDLYKDLANDEFSGGSYHKITINNANNFAWFEFKGTGFELISRTESQGYATLIVTVVDNATGKDVARIPVITEFDNTTNATDDSIFQVPVIRKDDLPYGTYTVYINGAPDYDFDNPNLDGSFNPIASYFYLDGLRIFQPMGSTNEHYNDKENGATFAEIRDLIIAGTAAAAKYDGTSVTVSTTTTTWTENYLGVDTEYDEDGAVTYEGNRVDSVEDYLILGPNNEVYMNGDLEDAALIFYVKKQAGAKANELQIAVRAIDYQKFHGVTDSTQALSAEILYGVKSGAEFAWSPLVTVRSSTEQYYSVDLTNCPVDADGRIQVAVKVNSGMASFTSLKYNGLDLVSVGGDSTTLRYENGMLVGVAEDGSTSDAVVNAVEYPAFRMLSRQMRASTLSLDPEPSVPEETVPDVTEPEATEPEATEPEVTEPDVTEPDVTEPEATEPEATEPDATEPEATEPEATEPEVTEPEETEPEEPEEPEEDPRERLWKSLMETIEFLFKLLKGRGGH